MRRTPFIVVLGVLALPAAAHGQAVAPADPPVLTAPQAVPTPVPAAPSASTSASAARPLTLTGFSVGPKAVVAGRPARVTFRLDGGRGPVRVRVVLVRPTGGAPVARLNAGRRKTGRMITRRWTVAVAPGRYVARLHAVDAAGAALVRTATGSGSGKLPVTVEAAPIRRPSDANVVDVPGASKVPAPAPTPAPTPAPATPAPAPVAGSRFPVRGAYTFGGEDARFGAGRGGHRHQGQDIVAAEGTPLVSPGPGSVYWRRVQPGGAGHYLVIRSDAGPDWVFMHLVAGSETVKQGDRVRAGQQIAQVGNTGRSSGPHLHFELWPDGWYAKGSQPIDPLPTLRAWAAG